METAKFLLSHSGIFFLFASIALAQVGGNLGIVMRQKSQIMPLFFIVYAYTVALKQRRLV